MEISSTLFWGCMEGRRCLFALWVVASSPTLWNPCFKRFKGLLAPSSTCNQSYIVMVQIGTHFRVGKPNTNLPTNSNSECFARLEKQCLQILSVQFLSFNCSVKNNWLKWYRSKTCRYSCSESFYNILPHCVCVQMQSTLFSFTLQSCNILCWSIT